MNAGRIMTCLSKGNIWRLRQKQDETPLSRGSRKRQTKSRHLSSRYFDLTFLINLLFGALLCVLRLLLLLLSELMAVSGSARLDVALLRPIPCHCCGYRSPREWR
jgi:hypothetical protein